MLEVSNLKFLKLEDKFKGAGYGDLKSELLALMFEQKITTFESESSPEGAWEPLKDVDQKLSRARKDFNKNSQSKASNKMRDGDKILHDTGVLRQSFTESSQGSNHSTDGDEIRLESNLEYAGTQNYGNSEKGIPARPFNLFSEEDVAELNKLIEDFINE